ncbi:hypothetical protein B9479_000972 [Cryptococcus floricola]|uniref:Uncharacterized protein n=1 Tax=Cryptococcus floricola TaxID=2591691 RepID=A0A5D3B7W4_9TREE|nr:hypothetical protein B9479_000972 [Cryptococcus floricola]
MLVVPPPTELPTFQAVFPQPTALFKTLVQYLDVDALIFHSENDTPFVIPFAETQDFAASWATSYLTDTRTRLEVLLGQAEQEVEGTRVEEGQDRTVHEEALGRLLFLESAWDATTVPSEDARAYDAAAIRVETAIKFQVQRLEDSIEEREEMERAQAAQDTRGREGAGLAGDRPRGESDAVARLGESLALSIESMAGNGKVKIPGHWAEELKQKGLHYDWVQEKARLAALKGTLSPFKLPYMVHSMMPVAARVAPPKRNDTLGGGALRRWKPLEPLTSAGRVS